MGTVSCKNPVIKLRGKILHLEATLDQAAAATLRKNFFRHKIAKKFVNIVGAALSHHKFSRTYVKQSETPFFLLVINRSKKIVFTVVKHIVSHYHSGSNKLGYTTFYKFFRQFWVFKLLAYRHTLACSDKLGQVCVKSVMRKTCQLDSHRRAIGPFRQCYTQYLRRRDSVIAECFIKIPHPEQQNCVGMLSLHLDILLHQRSLYKWLSHGSALYCQNIDPEPRGLL